MRKRLDLKPARSCLLAGIVLTLLSTAVSGGPGWLLLGMAAIFILASVILYTRERPGRRG